MKTIVYSCVTGRYDDVLKTLLASEAVPEENVEYILFTDRKPPAGGWESVTQGTAWSIRDLRWKHKLCNVRTARWHKINSHMALPEHNYSIWIDGSQKIKKVKLAELLVKAMGSAGLATFQHPQRNCVYQEMKACERLKKDSPAIMLKQIENYRSAGYPPYNGLVETACVVRENCRKTNTFNRAWYDLLSKYSRRDQLGFNYAAWLVEISYNQIEGSRASSPYFSFHHHHRG